MAAPNTNGLIAPAAYAAPNRPYYSEANNGIIENPRIYNPTIYAPIGLNTSVEGGLSGITAAIYVDGDNNASPAYTGAVNITPGGNTVSLTPGGGITVRTGAGPSTIMEVGALADAAAPQLILAGNAATGAVYDSTFNRPIKTTAVIDQTFSLNTAAPATSVYQVGFTPTQSGAYMLQVDVNLYNVDTIPLISNLVIGGGGGGVNEKAGAIEWTVTSVGGETQYMSSTLTAQQLTRASELVGVAEPMDYTISNMGFLTAGVAYQFNAFALKPTGAVGEWNLSDIKVRVVQMC